MATHSSILARKIPWTEEPGRLQSMGVTKSWTWPIQHSMRPHELYSPWNSPAQNTRVGSLALLQGIFQFNSWVGKICWRMDSLPTPVFLGLPCGSAGKESTCNVGDLGLIPGLGRPTGEGKDYPLQYCGLENSMDCIVHGVAKSQTRLSDFHF